MALFSYKGKVYEVTKELTRIAKSFMVYICNDIFSKGPNIIISANNESDLHFIVEHTTLYLCAYNQRKCVSAHIADFDISHLINDDVINFDLLIPYIENIYSVYIGARSQSAEILKQGRQTKRAN